MKMRTAPSPTSWMAGTVRPAARAAIPPSVIPRPQANRRRMEISYSTCCSVTAWTGAIRTARRAGPMAETIVIPTPTTKQTMTVRASKTSGPEGSVTPKPLRSASRPSAASTPSPRPMSDEMSPTIPASASTETKTCRRLAPTMRSSASSFVRCPTMIENVFRMVKPPTNSAMKANTSNAVLKKPNAELILLVCSFTTVWPVTTSTPRGSTPAIDLSTAALSAPGLATTSIESN